MIRRDVFRRIVLAAGLVLAVCGTKASAESVLVWSTGNSAAATADVAAWIQASGYYTSVTAIDQDAALTLPELLAYDRVLYFSNTSSAQDPTAIGDVLADYADTGRRLVLATFSWADQGGNTLGGRIITDGISPYVFDGGSLYTNVTMDSNDGSEFFDGVNTLGGFFHDDVVLTAGSTSHGTWSDGTSILASRGNVVGVNLFPDDSFGTVSGDYRQLFINAIGHGVVVPEPSSLALVGVGLVVGVLARVRARRSS